VFVSATLNCGALQMILVNICRIFFFPPFCRTKQVVRYRSCEVDSQVRELNRLREQLALDCHAAWLSFLAEFNAHYFAHKKAVKNVAVLDVLFSLVDVAKQESYCKYV
jgi:DNA mismatch repair ATPase MutS